MNIVMQRPRRIHWIWMLVVICCGCSDSDENSAADSQTGAAESTMRDGSVEIFDMGDLPDAVISDSALPDVMFTWTPTVPETIPSQACGAPIDLGPSVTAPSDQVSLAEQLASKADRFERVFHAFHTKGTGLNADLRVTDESARVAIEAFANSDEPLAQALEALNVDDLIADFGKAAGLYGGVGIAADAYRYKVLRDEGADCSEVETARTRVSAALEVMHIATRITGTKGVIVRALANINQPGAGQTTTVPLFNEMGQPLPLEKNNGTWRADQSGQYPDLIWEDSCSRDMYVGWALAYAAIWEVIRTDPAFDDALKLRLRADARALVDSLMKVGESGFDLEIQDADGRVTYHGIMHEHAVDRVYITNFPNGFNGLLAVGIVSALSYVSGDESQHDYVVRTLIDERGLLDLAQNSLLGLDLGPGANFSGYNMAFTGAWLASRYLTRPEDRTIVRLTLRDALYNREDAARQPREQSQALYHLVFAQSELGFFAGGQDVVTPVSNLAEVMANVRRDLDEFPQPPFFGRSVLNCDESEIDSLECVADDGTALPLLGTVGWNNDLIADVPVPMRLRPISNYYWRSNPYAVNGDTSELALLPGSDFRWVYWGGRILYTAPGTD